MIPQAKYSTFSIDKVNKYGDMIQDGRLERILESFGSLRIKNSKIKEPLIMDNYIYFQIPNVTIEDVEKEQDKLYTIENKMDVKIEWQLGDGCVEFIVEVLKKTANAIGPYYIKG